MLAGGVLRVSNVSGPKIYRLNPGESLTDRLSAEAAKSIIQNPVDGENPSGDETQKILTLEFSNEGAKFKFQTENEINQGFKSQNDNAPRVKIPLQKNNWQPPSGVRVSKTYTDILNNPVYEKSVNEYESLSDEEKRIFDQSLDKKIRQNFRKKSFANVKLDLDLAVLTKKSIKCFEFQSYLEQITKQLETEGLWREESAEVLESDLFTIADTKDEDLDENFKPKALDVIYKPKNMNTKKDSLSELKEEGLEWAVDFNLIPTDLPEFTTPTIHNLIRRAPWSLHESIARQMIEGSFFSNNSNLEELFPCAYFVSKSIFTRTLFIQVKYEAFTGTPLQKKFRTYSYHRYLKDQKSLEKITNEVLKTYFHKNPFVKENIKNLIQEKHQGEVDTNERLKTIWSKFLQASKELTKKQKEALNFIYVEDPKLTYEEAALEEGISKDSFQDRIKGAIKKIKTALPELDNLMEPKTYYKNKSQNLLYNGLFCKNESQRIHSLFKIDLVTKNKVEIPIREGKPKEVKMALNKSTVKAWVIKSTPIPDIIFTDFYLGLIPEAHFHRRSGRSKFRG